MKKLLLLAAVAFTAPVHAMECDEETVRSVTDRGSTLVLEYHRYLLPLSEANDMTVGTFSDFLRARDSFMEAPSRRAILADEDWWFDWDYDGLDIPESLHEPQPIRRLPLGFSHFAIIQAAPAASSRAWSKIPDASYIRRAMSRGSIRATTKS